MDSKSVGERIRQHRKIKGLTQEELAKKVDLSTMSIRRYESGERIIPEDTIKAIAAALGVTFSELTNLQIQYDSSGNIISMVGYAEDLKQFIGIDEDNDAERNLVTHFRKLNSFGQQEAVKRVEEMTENKKYRRATNPTEPTQEPTEDKK